MLAVAGAALWLGGIAWAAFVCAVAIGVFFEWRVLVLLFQPPGAARLLWNVAGAVYCAVGAAVLLRLREQAIGAVLLVLLTVIAVDVGAYFAGRTFGGPKIAPRISPSKTWAGLIGGMLGATLMLGAAGVLTVDPLLGAQAQRMQQGTGIALALVAGPILAIVAQAGDFFESWMKRRAGVKDSGRLLPGHGGLFDRVDGLLSVLFLLGIVGAIGILKGAW